MLGQTETKYKIFIPRKETVRATGKKIFGFQGLDGIGPLVS